MANALIGYTGFVGGNLLEQARFDDLYRSTNIGTIREKSFELIVCAGAPGAKWIANNNPKDDLASIQALIGALEQATAGEFILISTVDVYPVPFEVDEDTPIDSSKLSPYGEHRKMLEDFVVSRFPGARIIRLPGLFGKGLKKNVIYDFLHKNCLDMINGNASYQFYDLAHLWSDIQKIRSKGIKLINIATEPIFVKDIARECFGMKCSIDPAGKAPSYRMYTKYAELWGRSGHFLYSKESVMNDLRTFVNSQGVRRQ